MSDEEEKSNYDLLNEALAAARAGFFSDNPDLDYIQKEFTRLQWEIVYSRIIMSTLRTMALSELRQRMDVATELPLFHGQVQLAMRSALGEAGATSEEITHFLYGDIEEDKYEYDYMMSCLKLAEAFESFQTDVSEIRRELSQKENEAFKNKVLSLIVDGDEDGEDQDTFN